jgi:L-lactate dehydrogenase complex protein LldG
MRMFSEDGSFLMRIKSLLGTGKEEEQLATVTVEETVAEGEGLEDGWNGNTGADTELKSQIQEALAERPVYENISESAPVGLRTVPVSAPVMQKPVDNDLDIHFATKFIEAGGKFIFAENMRDAIENLKALKADMGWEHIFAWENEIKDAFVDNNFQRGAIGFTIENSDAAISLCETLIADDGTIILNPKQASRRRLPCFPKVHIVITDVARLTGSETEGLEHFYQRHKGELPSIIKLGHCNNGHFYDKQRLILNAEGPEDVYVILLDEIIPPSLRP